MTDLTDRSTTSHINNPRPTYGTNLPNAPSIEVAVKIADTLEVSLDYLVGKTSLELDKTTLKRIEEVSKLPAEVRSQVYMVIDALIRDFKAKQAYS